MNFKHELSPSKPLLRNTQSLILGPTILLRITLQNFADHTPKPCGLPRKPCGLHHKHFSKKVGWGLVAHGSKIIFVIILLCTYILVFPVCKMKLPWCKITWLNGNVQVNNLRIFMKTRCKVYIVTLHYMKSRIKDQNLVTWFICIIQWNESYIIFK